LAVTVGDVTPKDLNGQHFAKVTAPTTVELYSDAAFSHPVSGSGTGGTVTGSGQGAAALGTMGGGAQQALKTFFDGMLWPNVPNTLIGKVLTFRAMLATIFNLMIDLDGNLNARANLLGSIKLNVGILPPSISASLELLAKIAINLRANLEVALPDLTIALAASLDAQISAIADLVAKIGFFLGMGSANLEIWEYTGPGSGLGAAIASGPGTRGWRDLTPATTPVVAGIFGLTNPASATAFRTFFPGA
jgi:hypothetical protein